MLRSIGGVAHEAADVPQRTTLRDDEHMEIFCCTSKYRKLFETPNKLAASDGSETALGPWYANVLNLGSARLLHYMSSTSLLSVIIWQRERITAEKRFVLALEQLLVALGVSSNVIRAELDNLSSFDHARATDRSVLGSMRDQATGARYCFNATITPLDMSLRLAETPCGPRDYESPKTLAPRLLLTRWSGEGGGA